MKKKVALFIAAFTALAVFADGANALEKAWLKGTTDKSPIGYKPGEAMVFTIEPQGIKGEIAEGAYFLQWERSGDDGVVEKGREAFTGKPFVYKTSIAKPGFVRLYAVVVGADGNPFWRKPPRFKGDPDTPQGKRALRRLKKLKKTVFFDGGAAAGIDTLRQAAPEPADFDAFWARQKAELAKVPFDAKRVEVQSGNKGVRLYALSVGCSGGMPVTGYLSIPRGAETGSKYPIQIGAFGYGVGEQFAPRNSPDDAIVFRMNAHGFLLREFGGTDEYYSTYADKIKSNGYTYGFDPQQNSNPETAYFRGMILRLIRAMQYMKSLPEWDGKELRVSGSSQGGAFAIWGAGCGEGATRVSSTVTGFCDVGAELVGRLRGDWPRIKFVEALGYFDPVNFAKRIPATCRVDIPRAGLGDYTCQPSGLAVLWNTLKCPKTIVWMQGSEHGYIPPEYEGRDTLVVSMAGQLRMQNIAHRGMWSREVPQNTVEAIKLAYDSGATWVETDFYHTKAGQMVCIHADIELKRYTGCEKRIVDLTPEDVATLDLGKSAKLDRPYRIPLLEQVLAIVPSNCVLQAEIKGYSPQYADIFDKAVKAAGLTERNIVVSSFRYNALKDFKKRYPKYRTAWLTNFPKDRKIDIREYIAKCKAAGIETFCPGCPSTIGKMTWKDADAVRAAGLEFRVFGVNTPEALAGAAELGAVGFTCNYWREAFGWAEKIGGITLLK